MAEDNPIIACLGDSLTWGAGGGGTTYPAVLQDILLQRYKKRYRVINAGINGDTSQGALRRLDSILDANPYLVITCIGTNDMNLGKPLTELIMNLTSICRKVKERGRKNLILGVPNWYNGIPITSPVDHPLYASVAAQQGVKVQTGGLASLVSNPVYRSDNVHLNAAGYYALGYCVADTIAQEGLFY